MGRIGREGKGRGGEFVRGGERKDASEGGVRWNEHRGPWNWCGYCHYTVKGSLAIPLIGNLQDPPCTGTLLYQVSVLNTYMYLNGAKCLR